jgi:hypothetical protein
MDEDPWFCGETTDSDDKNEKIQDEEDEDGGSKPVWVCSVEVCDMLQDIGPDGVCDKCAGIAFTQGDGGFNDEGERLCDCSDCEKPAIGVFPGEGSASYLCEDCGGEWFDVQPTLDDDTNICCICGEEYFGYGHNPRPVKNTGRCCDGCNNFVIATRLRLMMGKEGDPPDYYGGYFFDDVYRTYRESYPEYMEES